MPLNSLIFAIYIQVLCNYLIVSDLYAASICSKCSADSISFVIFIVFKAQRLAIAQFVRGNG
jgi:hypothetical protein